MFGLLLRIFEAPAVGHMVVRTGKATEVMAREREVPALAPQIYQLKGLTQTHPLYRER